MGAMTKKMYSKKKTQNYPQKNWLMMMICFCSMGHLQKALSFISQAGFGPAENLSLGLVE